MTLDRCFAILDRNQISYSHSIHSPAWTARKVAIAEHLPANRMAKVVVYHGDNGYGMLLIPADRMVNFAEVLRLLGLRDIRLANEQELAELFPDCELGATPPFGNLVDLPVLVDQNLASAGFITFNGGTHRDVIHMSFADFRTLVNPLIAHFAIQELARAAS
jgi:Ala-tRNA(Pro) deacylase